MNNDNINHPPHYAGFAVDVECIDITRHLPFSLGNAVKYIWRAGRKGGTKVKEVEDLRKALWYVQDHADTFGYGVVKCPIADAIITLFMRARHEVGAKTDRIALLLYWIPRHDEVNLIISLEGFIKEIENSAEYQAEVLLYKKIWGDDK